MKTIQSLRLSNPLFCLLLFLTWLVVGATGQLKIEQLEVGGGSAVLLIRYDGGAAQPEFTVEHSLDLGRSDGWSALATSVVTGGGGAYVATATLPGGRAGFFRVRVSEDGEVITSEIVGGFDEGGGSLPALEFSAPFTGRIDYTITVGGVESSESILASGDERVLLPVPAGLDDDVVGGRSLATVRLTSDVAGLALGDGTVVLPVTENDEVWEGVLVGGYAGPVPFALEVLRKNGATYARFLSKGGGALPTGTYPVRSLDLAPGRFGFSVEAEVTAERNPALVDSASRVELVLSDGTEDGDGTVGGRFTCEQAFTSSAYLSPPEVKGGFLLRRRPLAPGSDAVVLVPAE